MTSGPTPPRRRVLRPVPAAATLAGVLPNLAAAVVLFVIPVGVILVYAFGTLDYTTLSVRWGWALTPLRQALSEPYVGAIRTALLIAVATTLICAVLGFCMADVIVSASPRWRRALLPLVLLPFWTDFLVRTYAWTNLIGPGGVVTRATGIFGHPVVLLGTPWGVLIGMVSTYLPLMVLPVYVALERVPKELVEAARDLGASGWRVLRTVHIPGAAPGIAAGMVLVGAPAAGEYVVPSVLGRGRELLIGNLISNQLQDQGNYPSGAALTLVLLTVLIAVLVLVRFLPRLWGAEAP